MLEMSIVTFFDELVAVTVCGALMVPSVTVPKFRLEGLTLRCAFPFPGPGSPGPCAKTWAGRASPITNMRKKLNTEKANADFARTIINPPREQLCIRLP
jgi:hypothetical protein